MEVKQKVSEAKKMLELWKSTYLETRAKIEASGRDSRWEFDRKKLFEKTDHMATVCEDLYHVAQVNFTVSHIIREAGEADMGPGLPSTTTIYKVGPLWAPKFLERKFAVF